MPDAPKTRTALAFGFLAALIAAATLAIPLYVIRPFRPQGAHELALALRVREMAPLLSGLCALVVLVLMLRVWKSSTRLLPRALLVVFSIVAVSAACLTHVNIFETMFKPYGALAFQSAAESPVESDDKVLSITLAGQNHAFPIRTMGYHHIVNDTLAGIPIAATYCTLCHTGIIWDRRLNGRTLYFTLAGINNGNALLRDRETGSIWQQSTGEAIFGPLKGQRLTIIPSDELTFAFWRTEQPTGQILAANSTYAHEYDPKDWEAHVARRPVVVDVSRTGIDPHTIMLGIVHGADSKAFPLQQILSAHLLQDRLPGYPVLLIVAPDKASIRAFSPRLPGEDRTLSFVPAPDGNITDRETTSAWNFSGCAVSGPLQGKCLPSIEAHKVFWFDWLNHHPGTQVGRT